MSNLSTSLLKSKYQIKDYFDKTPSLSLFRYLFSSSIGGSLNFVDATFSLAMCCVTYLCQKHHDHDLLDEDIDQNILSGAYRMHDFAVTTWFEFVERFIHLSRQDALSQELIDALETLRCERTQGTCTEGAEVSTQLSLEPFKSVSPALHDMLCKVAHFRRISLKGNFDNDHGMVKDASRFDCRSNQLTTTGSSWTGLDPLTISASSVRIYQQFNDLLCRKNKHQNCHCEVIRWHYGQRLFKCGYLSCSFRRHGFESRSLQKSHMKHHDRPWKCSIQDCAYAEGGFLSRKMRDDHYKDHIATGPQEIPRAENPEPDEIQPLLFDLVKADKVEVVRSLLSQFKALPSEIQKAIRECAASFGSAAMIDLIEPFDQKTFPTDTMKSSIRAGNVELFKHLLSRSKGFDYGYSWTRPYLNLVHEVLRSDSEENFETWVSYIDYDRKAKASSPWGVELTYPFAVMATAGHPSREDLLISLWEKADILKSFDRLYLGSALINVASSTCSVKLAKYFVDHGAEVDFRRSRVYLTPLHHAARQNSAAAAEMMKYLLLQGADPELTAGRAALKIRDEKGAKGIAQWLGMSWDELIAKTKEEREKIASKEHEQPSSISST